MRQKDVIRIGYVPSMHEDQRYRISEITQLGGGKFAIAYAVPARALERLLIKEHSI